MQVTPYASTLMDLVLEKSSGNHSEIKCKKVYTPRKKYTFCIAYCWTDSGLLPLDMSKSQKL